MGGIKVSIHPLFFCLGFYYALTGKIAIFLIYTLSAFSHEMGHSLVAANMGYRLNKISLMPFGAVVKGEIEGLKKSDEVKVALAGPLTNLAIAVFFVATWWIFPQTYAFTDVVAQANFSMAIVNFIPAYPLDGGRVLFATLYNKFGRERARKISTAFGVLLGISLFALFCVSLFFVINVSLLFFSLFVLFGALSKPRENTYVKMFSSASERSLLRGLPYKITALSKNATVKKLMLVLDAEAINEVCVFDGDKKIATLSQERITKIVQSADIYSPIEKYLNL